jgi:hypothetical protein
MTEPDAPVGTNGTSGPLRDDPLLAVHRFKGLFGVVTDVRTASATVSFSRENAPTRVRHELEDQG